MAMTDIFFSPVAPEGTPSVAPQPSILAEYVLFPFYDHVVTFYPKSWVPNKLTLVGVSLTLLSSVLLLSAMPAGTQFAPPHMEIRPASLVVSDFDSIRESPLYPTKIQPYFSGIFTPASLLFVCGVLNLLYCVADNTDGRLARRDGKTSVIGEYLDHGLDCVTSLFSACLAFAVMGGSLSNMAVSVCLIAFVTVLSHTLHYERSIFIWGNRIASVDEAMIFFGICMWIPLLFPNVGTAQMPAELIRLLPIQDKKWIAALTQMKAAEVVYILYNLTQAETIFSIIRKHWRMVLRIQVWFMALNSAVLLGLLSVHSAHVAAALPSTHVPGYTLGPFTYPAIWIITCACTCSIIVHVPIAARCGHRRVTDPLPLAGIMFVWMVFLSCPVGGAITAVVLHVAQILLNIQSIQRRSKAMQANKRD